MFSRNILSLLCYLVVLTQLINALLQPNEVRSTSKDSVTATATTTKLTKCAVLHGEHGVKSIITDAKGNDNSNNNNYGKRSDRDKLLFYSLNQLTLLSTFTVQHGTQLFRNVLKEASTLVEHTEILKAYLRDFSDYVARAERLKKLNEGEKVCELHNMAALFTDLVEHPNTAASEDATFEDMYLEVMLEQNGLSDLLEDILEHFLAFTDKFDARIKSYLDKLTAEQLLNECQMIEWFQIFSAERNPKKKMRIFSMFFDLYYSNS